MLHAMMKDTCRICARELCGNQRRWIFHTASKLNLQVLLSHVLGKEVARDGRAEFACSKCAFMLDRIYRFDTVIARIEALSIERLQKLLLEKDRLKLCVANLYKKNNAALCSENKGGEGTVDISNLSDARYAALLQEDFTYSGFESWTENDEQIAVPSNCQASEGTGNRPKRCHCCAVLRVPDADYEAVCKVPRKVARSISCLPSTRYSASVLNEELQEPLLMNTQLDKMLVERESMERISSSSSVESMLVALDTSPLKEDDELVKGTREDPTCNGGTSVESFLTQSNTLDMALTLVKTFDYRPVQSHKGSRIPIKSSPPSVKAASVRTDENSLPNVLGEGFLNVMLQSLPRTIHNFIPELEDLQDLYEDVYEDYMPLRLQNMTEKKQSYLNSDDLADKQCMCKSQTAEAQVPTLENQLQEMEAANKILQEKLHEMSSKLSAIREASQKRDCTIQRQKKIISSKAIEEEDLNRIIGEQNESIIKLQEMLCKSQPEALQDPGAPPPVQGELLNLQNSLFRTQLELQKIQRAFRRKERQLTDAKYALQLLETDLRDFQHQKETTWVQNQDLHVALRQLQTQLQETNEQLHTVEVQKDFVIREQQLTIERQNQALLQKEQLLQEQIYLLQCQEGPRKDQGIKDPILERLQERIRERDKALERAVDEKYRAVEEREGKLHQMQLFMREKEHDLQRLRNVLSRNEETINSLDCTLKSKDLEVQQISTAYTNLQWLKQEVEAKYSRFLKEREGFIEQLQTSLHDRHKELENIAASWLSQTTLGNNEMVEKLQFCLQSKEQMLQDILSERNQQAAEYEMEIQELFKTMSTRDHPAEEASENMSRSMEDGCFKCRPRDQFPPQKNSRVEDFADENAVPFLNQANELNRLRALLEEKEEMITELMERGIDHSKMMVIVKNNDWTSQKGNDDLQNAHEKDLANVREEFLLVSRKEREARMEVSNLRSLVTKQNEDLQVQAAEVESLTRRVQVKEELIKDLQVQLVNPEDVLAVESLTHEVLKLREKVAILESHGQDCFGNRSQELVLMLEKLAAERAVLNEALQSERLLYSNLVNFHSQPKSCVENMTMQSELEAVRALRGRLEEALGQSLQQLSSLEADNRAPIDFGGGDGSSLQALHKHVI